MFYILCSVEIMDNM